MALVNTIQAEGALLGGEHLAMAMRPLIAKGFDTLRFDAAAVVMKRDAHSFGRDECV